MLYEGDKGVSVAAHPPEGVPAEAVGLSTSNLPLIWIPHLARMPDSPAKAREVSSKYEGHYIRGMFLTEADLWFIRVTLNELRDFFLLRMIWFGLL